IRCENEKSELRWIVQARCIALLVLREEVVTDELRCRDDREAARNANANKCRMSVLSGCPLLDADQECILGIRLEVDVAGLPRFRCKQEIALKDEQRCKWEQQTANHEEETERANENKMNEGG